MLTKRPTPLTLLSVLVALTACSGGGGNNGADAGDPDQPRLFFGSTDPNASANGAAFASEGSDVTDLFGEELKVRVLRVSTNPETGEREITVSDEALTVEGNNSFTLTLDGQDVDVFENDVITENTGFNIGQLVLTPEFSGGAVLSSLAEGSLELDQLEFAAAVFGQETNPATIETLTGQVAYDTQLQVLGVGSQQGFDDAIGIFGGDLNLVADFGSGLIGGFGNGTVGVINGGGDSSSVLANPVDVTFALQTTAIQGNGFATDLLLTTCGAGATCGSESEIGGVFFGPNAEELAGLAAIDISITNTDGDTATFVGGNAFVGSEVD